MPLDKFIKKVLLIGSGPIRIGQAAEFDYSGTQACRALREEGVQVVVANCNPATIQTDLDTADEVYLEPLVPEVMKKIIEAEKPDGIIATMSGQTGLNLAMRLEEFLAGKKVRLLGTSAKTIELAEDREKFAEKMREILQPVPRSGRATSEKDGVKLGIEIGLPVMVRPDFCLGGAGTRVCKSYEELEAAIHAGLSASGTHSILVEKSLEGTAELEYEVLRDNEGNSVVVCGMENLDPVGVHTGESIVVAPVQTISDDTNQKLRTAAIDIVNALGVVGACNVQFALDQSTGEYWVIEVNPRASRSSALASKATGYPIARVAAKIALGYRLDEIENKVTGKTAVFEPALDYVVVKIPRWPFDKFRMDGVIGTGMKSTGEAMGIGRTFEEALHKAIRSLELRSNYHATAGGRTDLSPHELRLFQIKTMLANGMEVGEIGRKTGINAWFLEKINGIAQVEKKLAKGIDPEVRQDLELVAKAKNMGMPDARIASLCGRSPAVVRAAAAKAGVRKPVFKMVDTCAGEFEAMTPYYYSTREFEDDAAPPVAGRRKVIIVGSGPIRIGQGIEFDYCTVKAVGALRQAGLYTIVINNNPETVSTDYDVSDKLYFEPLTAEDVLEVVRHETELCKREGSTLEGVLVQFGGQTAMNLAAPLAANGVKILGTDANAIATCEDRQKFDGVCKRAGIATIACGIARSRDEAFSIADYLGYPVLVRPSFVLGGRAMTIVHERREMEEIVDEALLVSDGHPLAIDKFLQDATEIDVDCISDGETTVIAAIMEQIEEAGIHSGDSACVMPAQNLPPSVVEEVEATALKIAGAIRFVGLFNIQMAVKGGRVFVLEVNPRASRTVPFVSKATGVPIAAIAARLQCGERLKDFNLPTTLEPKAVCVKCPAFPFDRFPDCDPRLGPEMKSTGETMGVGRTFSESYAKAMLSAGTDITGAIALGSCGKWNKILRLKFPPVAGKPSALVSIDPSAATERINASNEGTKIISSSFAAISIAKARHNLGLPATWQLFPLTSISTGRIEAVVGT